MNEIEFSKHARERMERYEISEADVRRTIDEADEVLDTYGGRRIYQKQMDKHVLRVIVEDYKGARRIITVYLAKARRYAL
jgi:hypothetical protein